MEILNNWSWWVWHKNANYKLTQYKIIGETYQYIGGYMTKLLNMTLFTEWMGSKIFIDSSHFLMTHWKPHLYVIVISY